MKLSLPFEHPDDPSPKKYFFLAKKYKFLK